MKKTYVLDTNVLLEEPGSLFSFGKNEIVLPFIVLEELDKFKTRQDELGINAREVVRQLSGIVKRSPRKSLKSGIALPGGGKVKAVSAGSFDVNLAEEFSIEKNDNQILSVCLGIENSILVSNDLILRVKADACGIKSEEYHKHTSKKISDEQYSGLQEIQVDKEKIANLWQEYDDGGELAKIISGDEKKFLPNEFIHIKNGTSSKPFVVRNSGEKFNFVPNVFNLPKVSPRNLEQRLALDLLMDPKVNLVTIIGQAGTGKAQPLSAPVLTPNGWSTMGNIKCGDEVVDRNGCPTKVLNVFPQGKKEIYKISFSDGSATTCCGEHLWLTQTSLERNAKKDKWSVHNTVEIMNSLFYGKNNKKNHSIPMVKPVNFNRKNIDVDPYLLGAILGRGGLATSCITFSNSDYQMLAMVKEAVEKNGDILKQTNKNSYHVKKEKKGNKESSLSFALRRLKLLGLHSEQKFIPEEYKYNSVDTRIAVLQGLLDSNGVSSKNGTCISFTSPSENLSDGVREIVQSLGGKATVTKKTTQYECKGIKKIGHASYRVAISMPPKILPFRLIKKLIRFRPRKKYGPTRYIASVELQGVEEAQCILVDNSEHLYITENYIVTHNTLLSLAAGLVQVVDKRKYKSLVVLRPIQPLGKDIGYLPGSIEEKMEPWIAPIKDNLRFLLTSDNGRKSKNSDYTLNHYFEHGIIEVEAMTYIRGRSIADAYMIIDEAQNLSVHELKTIITRVGTGTKIILTGDVEQIDNMYVDSVSNGLAVAVDKFKSEKIAGHITLQKGERSELASLAAKIL